MLYSPSGLDAAIIKPMQVFRIGKKEGLKEGKIEMAKKSLKEGLPVELISKLTGLSKEEIEKL